MLRYLLSSTLIIMAKKKQAAEVGEREADSFKAMLDAQRSKSGSQDVYMARDGEELSTGLELPSFALMYLFDNNVYPISRMIGIAGAPMASKSSLGFEIARWHQDAHGFGSLIETEGMKYSESLIRSIQGDKNYEEAFSIAPVASVDEAQDKLTRALTFYTGSNNKTMLTALVLDSLTGVDTSSNNEKMEKEGHHTANMGQAKAWTGFFRYFSSNMVGYPVSLIVINHLKDKISTVGYGPPQKYTPGGDAQRFYSSLYFYVTRLSTKLDKKQYYYEQGKRYDRIAEVSHLKIKCDKSSLGTHGREIAVDFSWYHDENGNQHSYWDWDGAATLLLLTLQDEKSSAFGFVKLSEICDITETKTSSRTTYKSKRLGLEDAEAYEIGKAIYADKTLMTDLMKFFHIKQRALWMGKMPEITKRKPVEVQEEMANG